MANTTKVIKIGVFVPSECQLLDMACIDVFGMMSKEYLGGLPMIPKHIPELAPSMEIFYISTKASGSPDLQLLLLTAGIKIQPTHDMSHSEVQPGMLDILLVPGPDPAASWDEDTLRFLRAHAEGKRTDVLSVCTGAFLCGAAGLLEGRTVCGPRGLQGVLRKQFPGARFVGDEYRWYQDGNFWSCGGITNGNDLVAAYARSSEKHFPAPIVEIACRMAEVGERSQTYEQGQTIFALGLVWQIVKGWFMKPGK
ncbi:ThiJ/PfpI family protein [Colletotrichum orchidophilum]|uniref:ThiJ/PfpI family protein n=1 Tax=Colletotrichum orchidophilum TaxID=1209926 RepID=A0A1G4AV40_9PEZI|nr:ThiJ/PfpI family protein [Colletotrichum orchidophilum]OHE93027.1 ThiJ/PfpI family protein [Colletotrichum orchidophilum]